MVQRKKVPRKKLENFSFTSSNTFFFVLLMMGLCEDILQEFICWVTQDARKTCCCCCVGRVFFFGDSKREIKILKMARKMFELEELLRNSSVSSSRRRLSLLAVRMPFPSLFLLKIQHTTSLATHPLPPFPTPWNSSYNSASSENCREFVDSCCCSIRSDIKMKRKKP